MPASKIGPTAVRRQRTIRAAVSVRPTFVDANLGPKAVRKKRASSDPTPDDGAPASSNLKDRVAPSAVRKKRASIIATTSRDSSASSNLGEGDRSSSTAPPPPSSIIIDPSTRAIVQELVALQKQRVMTIKEANGSVSRIEHLIVEMIGFGDSENARKAAFARARTLRLAIERAEGPVDTKESNRVDPIVPLILQSVRSRAQWPVLREYVEKDMERLAAQLPGADYVKTVRGLGWLGFAVICAEATVPLQEYRTVAGLWKHMGLAVIDGRRQQAIRGERKSVEEAQRLFHPKERRGQLYGFLQDSMFRAQWRAGRLNCAVCQKPTRYEWEEDGPACGVCGTRGEADDVVLAHARGHYGEVYARRRAHTAERVLETADLDPKDPARWGLKRCHSDGTRIMAKALLRDLWRVSRGLPPRGFQDTSDG